MEKKEKKTGKKKFWKIFFISLGSLLGLVLIVICVALWLIFTPARVTPIVNKQLPKFIEAEAGIERAELTFFSSFPLFGLKIDGLEVANIVEGAPCDKLARVETVRAAIDIRAFLKRDEIILSGIVLQNGSLCAYVDSEGNANFDILPSSEEDTDEEGFSLTYLDLDDVRLDNINVAYRDDQAGIGFSSEAVKARVKGTMRKDEIDASASLSVKNLAFEMGGESPMKAFSGPLSLELKGRMDGDRVDGARLSLSPFRLTFDYGGDRYLHETELALTADLAAGDLARMFFDLRSARLSVGGLGLDLKGSVEMGDSAITTDLAYSLAAWPLTDIVALVPASFAAYLEGIEVNEGTLSSEGTVKGVMQDSTRMPLMDIRLTLENGAGKYAELIPLPVSDIAAVLHLVTDLKTDSLSFAEVERLSARTPGSSVSLSGSVDKLLSDLRFAGTAAADLDLKEAEAVLPDTMNVTAEGRLRLGIERADISMAQLRAMALEKMKVAGTLDLTDVAVVYDTISFDTDNAKIKFTMPNPSSNPRMRHTDFAGVSIAAGRLNASMGDMKASLNDSDITLHTSDVRDTTMMPAVAAQFRFSRAAVDSPDIKASVANPSGSVSLAQPSRRSASPRYGVNFRSDALSAVYAGDNYSYDKLDVRANVTYNEKETELFLRFLPRGSIDLTNAKVNMKAISDPIEIPAVKMDFNPFEFNIEHTNVNIGESDFSLQGNLHNIMPYFKGDSILRGDFDFASKFADLGALLDLTSADTGEEEDAVVKEGDPKPFLVPKRTDITLHANIDKAVMMPFFADTLRGVKGDILVLNNELYLDGLRFSTPIAAMQLSAKYRSIRPDHLYAYVDFHLLQIEIQDLLSVIPPLQETMPILESFRGKGEFHLGAEVYMWGDYSLKMPTIRGAASIDAEELTLIDGKTFTEILNGIGKKNGQVRKMFKTFIYDPDKGVRIDNLSAEFSAFRSEIKVWPFLLSIDKFKAVVEGIQGFDLNYAYTISLVESPLPARMSINVAGGPDKEMDFSNFALKGKNMDVYRPAKSGAVESQTLQLRKIIKEARESTVRPWDEEDLERMKNAH